jgi:hypothetical protein
MKKQIIDRQKEHLLILSESIDMQHLFLALLPLHVSAPCSHLAYRWTHLILINVNLVQQDATIQDRQKEIKNLVMGHKGGPDTKTNWPTERRSQNQLRILNFELQPLVKIILRPTISRPGCLVVRHPSGTRDKLFFFLNNL